MESCMGISRVVGGLIQGDPMSRALFILCIKSLRVRRAAVWGMLVSKLVYEKLRSPHVNRPWMSIIWKGFIPPKYSFVVWLAWKDRFDF
ncbi:hypothetical protein LIER_37010 [Lithospermum erythrorhizon]|uniref:Reverse transcriptase zinc-binding domain-containing protein n=1 Tax=Lithospermum erythrorhizon TaxID=34254 RepID=A0AAV3PE07_LITER